jgi:DNA replication protein DnaC
VQDAISATSLRDRPSAEDPFEQWPEVLGSARLTGAVLDRLTHRCHILEATGESYRLKSARKRIRSKEEV